MACLKNLFLANDTLGPASPDPRLYVADEQAMEPAVQYVQKIKQRCDPDTYRQFLDILSQYHHKPGTMDEVSFRKSCHHILKLTCTRKKSRGRSPDSSKMRLICVPISASSCPKEVRHYLMTTIPRQATGRGLQAQKAEQGDG